MCNSEGGRVGTVNNFLDEDMEDVTEIVPLFGDTFSKREIAAFKLGLPKGFCLAPDNSKYVKGTDALQIIGLEYFQIKVPDLEGEVIGPSEVSAPSEREMPRTPRLAVQEPVAGTSSEDQGLHQMDDVASVYAYAEKEWFRPAKDRGPRNEGSGCGRV